MTSATRPTSYDDVPYANDPYPSSHPDHLAAVATLAGLEPAPFDRCRVLELGCARGGNLIPMALGSPRGRFVGVDSSAEQLKIAREVIDALGLDNVAVEARDIREIDAGFGLFDYVICHGTYSWVSAEVRDKILEICARNLAPNGVAYVSYNTYPGWHLRGLVRDMMALYSGTDHRPDGRATRARNVLGFVARAVSPNERAYGAVLNEEWDYVRQRPDSYLLHDHLEEVNEPIYFHEFVRHAGSHGLRFVSEVQGTFIPAENFPPEVRRGVNELAAEPMEQEQLIDFLINRRFRQSVLCHDEMSPRLTPRPADLARLYVSSRVPSPPAGVTFRNPGMLQTALARLAAKWPVPQAIKDLTSAARESLESPRMGDELCSDRDAESLAFDLYRCYCLKVVEFQTRQAPFVPEARDKPVASPLARLQAASGHTVTNMRHESGRLNEFGLHVLRLLDGSHDRSAILAELTRRIAAGRSARPEPVPPLGGRGADPGWPTVEDLGPELDRCLAQLARFALLID